MWKKKRTSENITRKILINFLKIITLLAITPPICFVVTVIVLDFNPLTAKFSAYARVYQLSEWELPAGSDFLEFSVVEKSDDESCWLEGTISFKSRLSPSEVEDYFQSRYFEKYQYNFREFVIDSQWLYNYSGGQYQYEVTADRHWKC